MKVRFLDIQSDQLMDPQSSKWKQVEAQELSLIPAPLGMVKDLSPFMALSEDHGKVRNIRVQILHNGKALSVRLSWANETKNDAIVDLDEFSDGVAVMFPLTAGANAITMGDENNPVNAWLWKADVEEPYDVLAHGYSTSKRRPGKQLGLRVSSVYDDGRWTVVFQRQLRSNLISTKLVNFAPNKTIGFAVAVWDGGNQERAGQKSMLPMWEPLQIEA